MPRPDPPPSSFSSSSKAALRDSLASLGLPPGLLASVYESYKSTDSRLWLVDNSSRMKIRDSHVARKKKRGSVLERSIDEGGDAVERIDGVTRWEEARDCVLFHSHMASKCWIPTKICLVNDDGSRRGDEWRAGREYNLCWGRVDDRGDGSDLDRIRRMVDGAPLERSLCPLRYCVRSLGKYVEEEAAGIEARDERVTVIICTQGRATNRDGEVGSKYLMDFQAELSRLSRLPVKIILRLTTDSEEVRDVFNTMDERFDSIDVLDDFWGEALEVYLHNPWLTYTMGLHRLREAGLAPDLMDELDERPLGLNDIHKLCWKMFLGEDDRRALPHPDHNRDRFFDGLSKLVDREGTRWNPIKKRQTPMINVKKLEYLHDTNNYDDYYDRHQPSKRRESARRGSSRKKEPRHTFTQTQNPAKTATGHDLMSTIQRWGFRPPNYTEMYPLERLLVTAPKTFPANNPGVVEPHAYFARWKGFDPRAFGDHDDESDEERRELLNRAVRKAMFFLNPDKWPADLTNNQTILLKSIRNIIRDQEEATLG